ncbi:hypothetical protein O9929_00435 [Vibrio lentus]|nr:hypothetical protein [Vibrio lentus]
MFYQCLRTEEYRYIAFSIDVLALCLLLNACREAVKFITVNMPFHLNAVPLSTT